MRLKQSRLPILSLSLMAVTACCCAQLPEANESQIRAMMIINLTKFVDWPTSRNDARTPFTICVVGQDPVGMYLQNLLVDKLIQGRPATIRRDVPLDQLEQCHILYWPYPDRSIRNKSSYVLVSNSVLTVSEAHEAHSGSIVALPLVEGRVAIEINNAMARSANLVLSSRLLQLATVVRK